MKDIKHSQNGPIYLCQDECSSLIQAWEDKSKLLAFWVKISAGPHVCILTYCWVWQQHTVGQHKYPRNGWMSVSDRNVSGISFPVCNSVPGFVSFLRLPHSMYLGVSDMSSRYQAALGRHISCFVHIHVIFENFALHHNGTLCVTGEVCRCSAVGRPQPCLVSLLLLPTACQKKSLGESAGVTSALLMSVVKGGGAAWTFSWGDRGIRAMPAS